MNSGQLEAALNKLLDEVRRGLTHGFFECQVSCEVIKDGKRRLTVKAGRSYQFVIPEEEISKRDE